MIHREDMEQSQLGLREEKKEALFYTTEEFFGTRGKMRVCWPPRHILVPLEGEKEGKRIISYVTAMAKTCGAKVTLFTVARPFQWSLATPSVPAPLTSDLEKRFIPFVTALRKEGVDADFQIIRGEKRAIMKKITDSLDGDLVVLSNRYRHSWMRYFKGDDIVFSIDRLLVPTVVI